VLKLLSEKKNGMTQSKKFSFLITLHSGYLKILCELGTDFNMSLPIVKDYTLQIN